MILTTRLQELYNNLYVHMRQYIWDVNVIDLLADIEIESYTAFPDVDKLRSKLTQLRSSVLQASRKFDDDGLLDSIDYFLDNLDQVAVSTPVVKEVSSYHEDSESIQTE